MRHLVIEHPRSEDVTRAGLEAVVLSLHRMMDAAGGYDHRTVEVLVLARVVERSVRDTSLALVETAGDQQTVVGDVLENLEILETADHIDVAVRENLLHLLEDGRAGMDDEHSSYW